MNYLFPSELFLGVTGDLNFSMRRFVSDNIEQVHSLNFAKVVGI